MHSLGTLASSASSLASAGSVPGGAAAACCACLLRAFCCDASRALMLLEARNAVRATVAERLLAALALPSEL